MSWFRESRRHADAAIRGHRRAGRGIPSGTQGHTGKPSQAEVIAAENAQRKDLDQPAVSVGPDGIQYEAFREPAAKKPPGKAKPVNAPFGIDRGMEIENPHGKGGRYHSHEDPGKPSDWHYDDADPHPKGELDVDAMIGHMAHDVLKLPKEGQ